MKKYKAKIVVQWGKANATWCSTTASLSSGFLCHTPVVCHSQTVVDLGMQLRNQIASQDQSQLCSL